MNKINASVGILTFNSASTLRRTLENVREFDDIIICDGGSTDATLDLAREFGAQIILQDAKYKHPDGRIKDFSGPRNQMLDAAKHDWFLYIDSDETISDGLKDDIKRITSAPAQAEDPLVYKVPYGIITDGRYIKYSSNYPGYQHRFFNKQSGARFGKPVHERIYFDKAHTVVGTLTHPWLVYGTHGDLWQYIRETAHYRAMEVKAFEQKSWREYLRWGVVKNVRTSLGALGKTGRNYLLHGFKETAPLSDEIGRVLSPLILMGALTKRRAARVAGRLLRLGAATYVEPELKRLPGLLQKMPPGSVFMDVGANVGAYTAAALNVLPATRVYAFEPLPTFAAGIKKRFPGVVVEAVALSSQQGSAELKTPEVGGVPYFTRSTLEQFKDIKESGAQYIEVPLTTLDAYCAEHHITPGCIKIDVEGHEEAVLAGAWATLAAHHPALIIEIEQRRLEYPMEDIFKKLEALGYQGEFYDPATKTYLPVEKFSVEHHQNVAHFKSTHYINNFIFI